MAQQLLDGIGVVYVDEWLVVVDKPAGLLSVRGRGPQAQDCVHTRLARHWPDVDVVHRLDMATSGLMVFARGALAQQRLSQCFAQRAVDKRYRAIVAGSPTPHCPDAQGFSAVCLPLAADPLARPRQRVGLQGGRPSLSVWKRLGPAPGPWGEASLLELRPVTGRSHQLRVHLSAIGHPILGDALYAPDALSQVSLRLLLHAQRLCLPHPADSTWRVWESTPPF
jgi:tRNA pseudouridine32 synthase/23S rRNA pseudouridine746 synthase